MKKKPFSDLMIGLAFVVLGIVVFIMASNLQKVRLGIGPGGFPKFIAVVMVLLGAGLAVPALVSGFEKPKMQIEKKPALLFLACVALCVLYVELVPTVGFLLLTPLLMVGMMLLFGNRNVVEIIVVSLVTTVVVWLLFTKVFLIFLPTCRLF